MNDNTDSGKKQIPKEGKYWWLKLKDNFFDQESILLLETEPNGAKYIVLYLKLLLMALSKPTLGLLRYNENIPYTDKTLATITRTDIDVVRSGVKAFEKLGLLEMLDDGTFFLSEVKRIVGSETTGASRQRKYAEKKALSDNRHSCGKASLNDEELEQEKELEKEKEKEVKPVAKATLKKQTKKEYQEGLNRLINNLADKHAVQNRP